MSIPKLNAKAQSVFNKWIRLRDCDIYGNGKCISCGKPITDYRDADAGHYVPVKGGSFLRFHEDNVHLECKGCNGFDEFHLVGYRKNLIEKIGIERVEYLESNRRKVKKWSRSELEEIIKKYTI